MVGSTNNKYGNTIVAFKTGERVSLEFLNSYATKPENRVDINRPYRPSKVDRITASKLYPEWYQRVVVEGNKRPKKWNIGYRKKMQVKDYALYEWWKRQIIQIGGGHRYFFLMCLVIYACKCDVPRSKLKVDLKESFDILRSIPHENELTQYDLDSAMECYSKDYYNFTIADIELLTGVRIERNKRNYQKQEWHLEDIRSKKANMKRRGQEFKNPEGRPSKQQIVLDWLQQHPSGSKSECQADTGLSYPTIRRWWNPDKSNS